MGETMPKLKKADYARELCRHRRLLGLGTDHDHFDHLTVPLMTALLKKFVARKYVWAKRDYVDWIVGVRTAHQLPTNRHCYELQTVKALKAEKQRITSALAVPVKKAA